MDWIFDNLQIAFLVVVGVISLFKSLLDSKAKKAAEEEERDYPEESYEPEEAYEQAPRRSGPSVPPPLWGAPAAAVPPPLRDLGYEAAVANEAAQALKHQQDLALRLQQIRETKATITGGAAATRARIANKDAKKAAVAVPMSIRARLKDPAELRRAFITREILDPPVSLR